MSTPFSASFSAPSDAMDLDMDTTAAAAPTTPDEDLDVLAMDLDVAFQGLGTAASAASAASSSRSSPPPSVSSRRGSGKNKTVVYRYGWEVFTAEGRPDFGIVRRNIRHIDTVVRNLAGEPYAARRAAVTSFYRPFSHMARALDEVKRRGLDGAGENNLEVGQYIRHMRHLKPVVAALGSAKDDTRELKDAVDRLERTKLPEQKIIKLKLSKTRSSDEGGVDQKMTRMSDLLRRFRFDNSV
ncbi:hypothetical protein V8F20_005175 [Naviculisporaceae sp. PSN 640]